MSKANEIIDDLDEGKGKLFYVHNSSIFDNAPYYQKEKIAKALTDAGFKDVHSDNAYGWSNQPEVVVFRGDPEKAKKVLMDAGDDIHPLIKKYGVIINDKDWKKHEGFSSRSDDLAALSEEDDESSYYILADTKEADKITKSGKEDKALFKGNVADAQKYAKEKMRGKNVVLLKRDKDKISYAVGESDEGDLYAELKAAGVEVDHHESDLYFLKTDKGMEILAKYPLKKKNATFFRSNIDGKTWVDVPFSYSPFWDKVAKRSAEKTKKESKDGGNVMSNRAKDIQKLVESVAVDEMYALGADHIVNWMKKVAYERFDVDPASISVVPWPQDGSDFNIKTPLTEDQYNELAKKITRNYPLYVVEFAAPGTMKFFSNRTVGTKPENTEELYPREPVA